jgi:glutamyl-tRNA synthetase
VKLSKRHGATSVREFRSTGYQPEALINYLALVGWSYDDAREFFSLVDLEKLFTLEKVNKAPAVFDYQKLEWFNASYIRQMPAERLAALLAVPLTAAGFLKGSAGEEATVRAIVPLVQERIKLLPEVTEMVRFIFEEPPAPKPEDLLPKKTEAPAALEALRRADALIGALPESAEETEKVFRMLAEELGMKLGDLLMPVRVAVTGAKVSPPLFESIRVMGVERARARTARAISILSEHSTRR